MLGDAIAALRGVKSGLRHMPGGKGGPRFVVLFSQASSASGMTQKEQQQVVQDFKKGLFNVIVATCIGEEGLDIGEVDLIVHYDCVKSTVRNTQRNGRTGRKRAGRVVQLALADGAVGAGASTSEDQRKLQASAKNSKKVFRMLSKMYEAGKFRMLARPPPPSPRPAPC